jgi:hypothetical protein
MSLLALSVGFECPLVVANKGQRTLLLESRVIEAKVEPISILDEDFRKDPRPEPARNQGRD